MCTGGQKLTLRNGFKNRIRNNFKEQTSLGNLTPTKRRNKTSIINETTADVPGITNGLGNVTRRLSFPR